MRRRPPSRPEPRRSCPCTCTGSRPTCPRLAAVAARHNLAIVEDCCQAHLATCEGRPVGSFGAAAAFSFYPTKNLGALGDGGAITTDDAQLAARLRRLRNGGQTDRYHHGEFGVNSRLDEHAGGHPARPTGLFAQVDGRTPGDSRRRYRIGLEPSSMVTVPPLCDVGHVYHLFPVRTTSRDARPGCDFARRASRR